MAPAPAVDAALAPVAEYMAPASAVYAAPAHVVEYSAPTPTVCTAPAPVVNYISRAPAVSYVTLVEYIAPAASHVNPAPVVEYMSPAPVGYAAPAPVFEYTTPAPVEIAAPAPGDEYMAPAVCAAPAPVVEYIAPAPAVSYVAPATIVDVLGLQFHEDNAETSCKATASGGRLRKSARRSPNGPEVFELECGSGSSLHPLRRRDEIAEDETLPEIHEIAAEIFEIAEDETSPEIFDITDSGFEEAANLLLTLCQQNEKHSKSYEIQRQKETETCRAIWYIVEGNLPRLESLANTGNVGTSVNGIVGASYEFWDEDEEDEDGPPIIRVEEQEWPEIIQNLLTMNLWTTIKSGHGQREKWTICIHGPGGLISVNMVG